MAGTVAGVLFGVRTMDGPYRGIPTQGLVFFGALLMACGLAYLTPWFAKRQTRSAWDGKTVFGKMPPREALPGWRRALWDLQEWVIERDRRRKDAMRRDPRPYQLRASAMAFSAGATLLIYAALR